MLRANPAAATTTPTTARTPMNAKAVWKPWRPDPATSTVDTAATPAAPPISRMVSTRPDASPVAAWDTPDRAPICRAGPQSPKPTPANRKAGSRSAT
jgi:hypothetical protein